MKKVSDQYHNRLRFRNVRKTDIDEDVDFPKKNLILIPKEEVMIASDDIYLNGQFSKYTNGNFSPETNVNVLVEHITNPKYYNDEWDVYIIECENTHIKSVNKIVDIWERLSWFD